MTQDGPISRRIGRRIGGLSVAVLLAAWVGIVLCVASITFLAGTVGREVDALGVAISDNTQWSLGQTEVELLLLHKTIHTALAHNTTTNNTTNLADVRLRFDILYSRIHLIGESQQFAGVRKDPEAAANLLNLNAFLDQRTPAFDGPDAGLLAQLPAVAADVEKLLGSGRALALLGMRLRVEESDARREGVSSTLAEIGYLTLLLVLVLMAGVAILVAVFFRMVRSERAIEDARNRLQAVIATSLDGIIAAGRDGLIVEYNGAAERLFGYARSEAIGRDIADIIVPAHQRAAHLAGMRRAQRTGEAIVIGKRLVRLEASRKDGTLFPVEVWVTPTTFDGREIFVSFLRDISDRVVAEQELIQARDRALASTKAKADLLAMMSHEMRTPLNGILGAIELLEDARLSARQNRFIAAIKTSAELLLHHVNGVLSMSRAEAGQLDLFPENVDPSALLLELVESQSHAIEANGNQVRCNTSAAPERISVDPLRLRQVVLNLIGNANKFTRSGEILVECDTIPNADQVEFRVIDTGIGIAEENLERIFEEFRTVDASYSRPAEGSGLGLSISRRLVQAMGGEIGVDSEPGEGSLFWVRLPIGPVVEDKAADPEGRPEKPDSEGPQPRVRSMHVLLVEDNYINRLLAREMLIRDGHSVSEAHDGREGVRLAGLQPFDLILMDISMSELDGVTATILIRESNGPNRATPIFALTAHALPEDAERFRDAGITTTLTKPLAVATLRAALSMVRQDQDEAASIEDIGMAKVFADITARLGKDGAVNLYERFRKEGDELLSRIRQPRWSTEPDRDRADAMHKVAGSASVLGAARFRRYLQLVEQDYRSGQADAAMRHLVLLEQSWNQTTAEIDDCKARLAAI